SPRPAQERGAGGPAPLILILILFKMGQRRSATSASRTPHPAADPRPRTITKLTKPVRRAAVPTGRWAMEARSSLAAASSTGRAAGRRIVPQRRSDPPSRAAYGRFRRHHVTHHEPRHLILWHRAREVEALPVITTEALQHVLLLLELDPLRDAMQRHGVAQRDDRADEGGVRAHARQPLHE